MTHHDTHFSDYIGSERQRMNDQSRETATHNKEPWSSPEIEVLLLWDRTEPGLDEVDALSPKAQVSLLRFLEDGKYRLLGGGRLESADVRILAASNVSLQQLVDEDRFRADLHYRLNVMELAVPPLRVRGEDIVLLARHFIQEAARRYGMPQLDLHGETLRWLASQAA